MRNREKKENEGVVAGSNTLVDGLHVTKMNLVGACAGQFAQRHRQTAGEIAGAPAEPWRCVISSPQTWLVQAFVASLGEHVKVALAMTNGVYVEKIFK